MSSYGVQELEANAVVRLPRGPGVLLRVEAGQVLVTCAGDPEDHVLEAGAAMDLSGAERPLAWALRTSRIEVQRLPDRTGAPAGIVLAR